jgi:glutamyl-Q tRNA(Asp) synthetase
MTTGVVTRFAPSPTGELHLGHAFSALTAWDAAVAAGGRFLLRIEDIDTTRVRPVFETGLLEDLAWLGLTWETPVLRQSEHLVDYHAALEGLAAKGLIYRCFRTRADMAAEITRAPHGSMGPAFVSRPLPPAEETDRLSRGDAFAWRLSLSAARKHLGPAYSALAFTETGQGPTGEHGQIAAMPDRLGDIVLARKDVGVAYHLAVVIDDALQGVTDVIRGCDLFEAAHIQRLLQALLELPTPVYRHHPLLLGADGKRLAKRNGSPSLRSLREAGETVREVRWRMAEAAARP